MAGARILGTLLIVGVLASPAPARPGKCQLARVDVVACPGTVAAGSATFCFGGGCAGTGVVSSVQPLDPPFSWVAFHIDGVLGSRPVPAGGFPVLLLPGDQIVGDFEVVLAGPGQAQSSAVWSISGGGQGGQGQQGGFAVAQRSGQCSADLVASAPGCQGADPGHPCTAETCVAGACVPVAVDGPCTDRCSTGGTCVAGACVGGTPIDCTDGQACTVDACDPALGCVHTPVDAVCDDHDPCTVDACDPQLGCVHTPGNGGPCDDADPCTTNDRCRAGHCQGDPMRCSDPFACTDDRCVDGQCQFVPVDARCDAGECALAACRPDDPAADRRGCVAQPVGDGEACTDDGRSCTDDVCTGGGCLHVPVDARCGAPNACTAMVCAPERSDADPAGCTPAGEAASSGACAEDGDPCSVDTCQDGTCRHQPIPDWQTCTPVQGSFRKALGLVSLARGLRAAVVAAPQTADAGAGASGGMLTPLGRAESDLQTVVAMLAGQGVQILTVDGMTETPAQARARSAFQVLLHTPGSVRTFVGLARGRRARATLGVDGRRTICQRGAVLLRGTKSLKAELRRLQRVSRTFAR